MAELPAALSLEGRVAVVTGAGSEHGIGFAAARFLQALGARVAVTATSGRVRGRAAELGAVGVVADLTVEADVDRLRDSVTEALGAPTVLVNAAGMTSVTAPDDPEDRTLAGLSLADWRAALARDLDTAFLTTRALLPAMLDGGWGRVVMVSSVTGPVMAMRGEVAYAAAKAGMVGLARAVALDHARDGVTANAVAPGWTATASQLPHEVEEGLRTPVGRSATPEEVAAAVGFLCSPGAAYVTGQCLVVDGGGSVAEERG